MKTINLLPKSEIKELQLEFTSGQIFEFWFWVLISLATIFVLALSGSLLLNQRISTHKAEIENKKASLNSASTKQLEQEVLTLNKQIKLITTLKEDHYHWSNILVELTNLVDSDARLETIEMDRASGEVKVTGKSATRDSVLSFWAAVKKSKFFSDINFPLPNLEKDVEADFYYDFMLNPAELKKE